MVYLNHILKEYAKQWLNEQLPSLPDANVEIFHMMYGRDNGNRSVADALEMSTSGIIDEMLDDQLNHAMKQVENSKIDLSFKRDELSDRGIFFQEADGQWMFYSSEGDGDGLYYTSIYKAIYEANKFYPLS